MPQSEKSLSPAPLNTPMFDQAGNMTVAWQLWFQKVYKRMGGGSTDTLDTTNANVTALQGEIDGFQAQLDTQEAQIVDLQNTKQDKLGFTPVQQGGGAGQTDVKVYVGWSGSDLKAQVGTSDLGAIAFKPQGYKLQDVTLLRSLGTVYLNDTDKTKDVYINGRQTSGVGNDSEISGWLEDDTGTLVELTVNGTTNGPGRRGVYLRVPPGRSYKGTFVATSGSPVLGLVSWFEGQDL